MAIETTALTRIFKYNDLRLPDPDASMSPDDVLEFYSNQYPELTNANVGEFFIEDDKQIFELNKTTGTKG
jgi:PRTRC genetic system protein C